MIDGSCNQCANYERVQDGGKNCGPDLCTEMQKLLISGRCETCPDSYMIDGVNRICPEYSIR